MEYNSTYRKVESYIVPKMNKDVRLSDLFTPGIFKTITSRKAMKNAIKRGLVKVNGDVGYTSDYIRGGECIEIYQNKVQSSKPSIDVNIEVVYEDEYLAIVNKPCGIVVSGNKRWTLENALVNNLKKSKKVDALQRPEPVHRLDYPTSGALLVGKTSQSVSLLNKLFEERKIEKTYIAITIGKIKDEGVINASIETKTAKTVFKIIDRLVSPKYEFLNFTVLTPHTGRRHQLRIHLSQMGNPIFGDLEYGEEGYILKGKGLYLHAYSLRFIHPFTNVPLYVNTSLPKKFLKLFPELNN